MDQLLVQLVLLWTSGWNDKPETPAHSTASCVLLQSATLPWPQRLPLVLSLQGAVMTPAPSQRGFLTMTLQSGKEPPGWSSATLWHICIIITCSVSCCSGTGSPNSSTKFEVTTLNCFAISQFATSVTWWWRTRRLSLAWSKLLTTPCSFTWSVCCMFDGGWSACMLPCLQELAGFRCPVVVVRIRPPKLWSVTFIELCFSCVSWP